MDQDIRFCTAPDGVRLAYATVGEGPPLVKAANWLSHLEFDWDSPVWRHWLRELSRDHVLVRYDERGCGLSDWDVADFSFEAWVRDLETVVDTLGLERFPLLGISQGGPVAVTYAVRHPGRVSHLILYGAYARGWAGRDLSAEAWEELQATMTLMRRGWGRNDATYRQIFTSGFIPDATLEQMRWFNDLQKQSASGENAVRFMDVFAEIDVVDLLPQLDLPTLVIHVRGDRRVPFEEGRRLAAAIPNARFVPLEGQNHIILESEPAWPAFLREVRTFLGVDADAASGGAEPDMVTILFTDMEGSTTLTQRLGDAKAQERLRTHNAIIRDALKAHGGSEIKHTGDGIMASFPAASSAIECSLAIQRAFEEWNRDAGAHSRAPLQEPIRVRIGLNAGEPVSEDEDLFGTAVQLAARVCANAEAGQVLASNVVRELAAGKGFLFSDRGDVELRGFEDPVRLYQVRSPEDAPAP